VDKKRFTRTITEQTENQGLAMSQMYLIGICLEDDLPPGRFDSFRLFCIRVNVVCENTRPKDQRR
jgi:hypothetical protein